MCRAVVLFCWAPAPLPVIFNIIKQHAKTNSVREQEGRDGGEEKGGSRILYLVYCCCCHGILVRVSIIPPYTFGTEVLQLAAFFVVEIEIAVCRVAVVLFCGRLLSAAKYGS